MPERSYVLVPDDWQERFDKLWPRWNGVILIWETPCSRAQAAAR